MRDKIFRISFDIEKKAYKGWVNPEIKTVNGIPSPQSFYVVLNHQSVGHFHFNDCRWLSPDNIPQVLREAIGKQIENHYRL